MRRLLAAVLLALASSPLFAQQIREFECGSCNPTDPNDAHVVFTLQALPLLDESLRAGDSVIIRNHNALNEGDNGAVCVSDCDLEGIYQLKPDGTWRQIWAGTGTTTLQASGGVGGAYFFYPVIIPGNAGFAWTFTCRIGSTPVSCATGDPV